MLGDLFQWWTREMQALLLPRHRAAVAADGVVVRAHPDGALDLAWRRRGRCQPIGTARPDAAGLPRSLLARIPKGSRVVLELPHTALLEQHASLPLAAEADLGMVLRHEMDRLTPFAAADIFWGWTLTGRDRANGRLTVRLSIVVKAAVASLVQSLAAAGLTPGAIEVQGADGAMRVIGTAPPGSGTVRRPFAVRAAGGACLVLALGALLAPVARQEWALASVDGTLDALRPRMALVDGLRRRIAAQSSGAARFAAEAARNGNALQALAAVTQALPDDTYLTGFTLRSRKLTLTGRSEAAVRLIGLLSAARGLADPAFAAPVLRLIGDHGEQFTISVDLAS